MLVNRAASLEKIGDVDTLWHAVVESFSTIGLNHVIYLTVSSTYDSPFLRSTMPNLYDNRPPQEDPFLRYSCDNYEIAPIGKEFVDSHPYLTDSERAFIERAGQSGFHSGLAIPMRLQGSERFGGFILGTSLDRATFMARMFPRAEEFRLFCLLMHRRIEDLTSSLQPIQDQDFRAPLIAPPLTPALDKLTPREREVIYLLAQGRSRKEAAKICNISIHTVSDYAKSGYQKLGVHNPAQAAALINKPPAPLDE